MYSDSHVRAWIKAFSWKSLKRKDPDKRPVFVQEWKWKRIASALNDGSTFHTEGADETTALTTSHTQAPTFSTSCCLNTFQIAQEDENAGKNNHLCVRAKGIKGPQKDSIRAAPPGPSTAHVLTQSLSALGSKLLNHFIRRCVPICWWEISHSSSWPQSSLPYFLLLNALLATIRHWGSGWLSLENWKVSQPAWKVTLYFGSNSRLSAKDVFCSWKTTEILIFPFLELTTFQDHPICHISNMRPVLFSTRPNLFECLSLTYPIKIISNDY